MKKVQLSLMALALVVGISGAFAFKSANTVRHAWDPTYDVYEADGTTPISGEQDIIAADVQSYTSTLGCSGSLIKCVVVYQHGTTTEVPGLEVFRNN